MKFANFDAEIEDPRPPRIRKASGAQLACIAQFLNVSAEVVAVETDLPLELVDAIFNDQRLPSFAVTQQIWSVLSQHMPRRPKRKPVPTKPVAETELSSPSVCTTKLLMEYALE